MSPDRKIRILVAEDHVIARVGVTAIVNMFTIVEYVVCREATGIAITQQQQPVVVGDTLNVLVYFPLFTAGGLYLRRTPEAHKRLMLMSCVVMLDPVAARFFTLFSIAGLRNFAAVLRFPSPFWLCRSWRTIWQRGGALTGPLSAGSVGWR